MRLTADYSPEADGAFAALQAEIAMPARKAPPTNEDVLRDAMNHPWVAKHQKANPNLEPAPAEGPEPPPPPGNRPKTPPRPKTAGPADPPTPPGKTQPSPAAAPTGPEKTPTAQTGGTKAPEWLNAMSDAHRQAYFADHPRSKWRGAQVDDHLKANPQHIPLVKKFLSKLTGRGGALTQQAHKKVQPEHIPPHKAKQVCNLLRQASGQTGKNISKSKAAAGFKAAAITMASVGMLTVGGAGLYAAGVPLACFTPHLLKMAYRRVRPSKNDHTLLRNFCHVIRNTLTLGIGRDELKNSLVHQKQTGKSQKGAPTISGKATGKDKNPAATPLSDPGAQNAAPTTPPPAAPAKPMPRPAPLGMGDPFGSMFSQKRPNPIPPG